MCVHPNSSDGGHPYGLPCPATASCGWAPAASPPYGYQGPQPCGYTCNCENSFNVQPGDKCIPSKTSANPCPADAQWYQGPKGGSGVWGVECDWKKCDTYGTCQQCLKGTGTHYGTCVSQCESAVGYNAKYPQSWNACWADCCSEHACHAAQVVVDGQNSTYRPWGPGIL